MVNDICLLDLGNSRFKWRWVGRGGAAGPSHRRPYGGAGSVAELIAALRASGEGRELCVASVRDAEFEAALREHWTAVCDRAPRFLRVPEAGPLRLAYRDPSRFGVDRYLALLGARSQFRAPLIVVDAGTVVTFDALDVHGDHLGGCLFPGLRLLRESLQRGAAGLAGQGAAPVGDVLADSTAGGLAGGVQVGLAGALRAIVAEMRQRMGEAAPTVVVTGGDADVVAAALGGQCVVEPDLVFLGMEAMLALA